MNENELPDDGTIHPDDALWRRIPPWHIVFDENQHALRISSAAFDDNVDVNQAPSPMSVTISSKARELGLAPESSVQGHDGFGLASFTAAQARSLNQRVARTPDADNPAHGSVIGKKTKTVKKRLAEYSIWVIRNPNSAIREHIAKQNPDALRAIDAEGVETLLYPKT